MRLLLLTALAVASAFAVGGCLHAPMPWSPDGRWLAYTVESRPVVETLQPGWLFDGSVSGPPGSPRVISKAPATSYRLWATRPDNETSVLLEDSPGPLTSPGWSPDGRALAFGRVVPEAGGTGRLEIVILEGTARRVISSRALPARAGNVAALPALAIAWSPDGRYLAVPQIGPDGLAIIRADNGRQVNVILDAFLPSWSPDGGRLAFYVRGTADTLHCIDSALGQPHPLAVVGHASQAPCWTRDGLSVLVLVRAPMPGDIDPKGERIRMQRVRVEGGLVEPVKLSIEERVLGLDRSSEGYSIALDREGENLFCSGVVEGVPHQIGWYRLREGSPYKMFTLLDQTAPMGSLSLSPDGRTLAARVGPVDRLSAPALCDLESPDLRSKLLAPDDESRIEWVATLIGSARMILSGLPVPSTDPKDPAGSRVERPTLLPVLGEFDANPDAPSRLARIGRMGRSLCDRPIGAPAPSPELAALLDEARLFFDYLRADYTAALGSLEALEERAESPDRRFRLLCVRAQIYLAQGRLDRAGHTIGYLCDREARPAHRLESTGAGFVLTPDPSPVRGWPAYLALKAEASRLLLREDSLETHVNPDAPGNIPRLDPPELNLNQIFQDHPGVNPPPFPGLPNPGGIFPRPPIPRGFPSGMPRR